MDSLIQYWRREVEADSHNNEAIIRLADLLRRSKVEAPYEIRRSLVVSRGHINRQEHLILLFNNTFNRHHVLYHQKDNPLAGNDVEIYSSGIYIRQEEEDFMDDISSSIFESLPNIKNLMKLAFTQGCEYLVIHVDGLIYDNLPTF